MHKMLFTLKRENPGNYQVKVNNTHRYNIQKTSGNAWVQSWEVIDLVENKKFWSSGSIIPHPLSTLTSKRWVICQDSSSEIMCLILCLFLVSMKDSKL